MCACALWLLCCALAHEASSSDTCHLSSPIVVVVVVAFVRRDMKMPCACAQGLVVNAPKASLSTFVIIIMVVVVVVAVKQCNVNASGLHQGPCH
jgi:hypothetical protein